MRGRRVLMLSLAVVAAGVVAALGAMYLDPARAAVGPMPGLALSLPADTRSLTGIDVRRFVASPFYKRYARPGQGRPQAFAELEARTGINPERDVDQVVLASSGKAGQPSGMVMILGRFDRQKVDAAARAHKNVSSRRAAGSTVYTFREAVRGGTGMNTALAFMTDAALLMGPAAEVERTLVTHAQGGDGLKGNAELMALVQTVRPGATFWTVGDQALLSQMPASIPGPGGAGGSLTLPGLKSLVVTGDLDPSISFEAVAHANDETAARQLGDVVRGLIALATLQASQKPELQQLASAVTVTNEAARVRINGRITYELLDALQPKRPVAVLPQASPPNPTPAN